MLGGAGVGAAQLDAEPYKSMVWDCLLLVLLGVAKI